MVVLYRKLSLIQVIQYVSKLYPQMLEVTNKLWKGYLAIPKKVTKNCQDIDFTFDF